MTTTTFGSLAAHVNEEPDASDHVLNLRIGQIADKLEQSSVYGPNARHLGLHRAGGEERARLDPDGRREPGDEVRGGLEPSPLDPAHRLGGHADRLGDLGLGQASFISEGSEPSPDADGFMRSGHAGRVGRQTGPQKGRSRHVMRLDVTGRERDHGCREETTGMLRREGSTLAWLPLAPALLAGCAGKAKPDYDKCVEADTAGDIQNAKPYLASAKTRLSAWEETYGRTTP
jgi:hypothetical protein